MHYEDPRLQDDYDPLDDPRVERAYDDDRSCPHCGGEGVAGGSLGWHHEAMRCRACGQGYAATKEWPKQEAIL